MCWPYVLALLCDSTNNNNYNGNGVNGLWFSNAQLEICVSTPSAYVSFGDAIYGKAAGLGAFVSAATSIRFPKDIAAAIAGTAALAAKAAQLVADGVTFAGVGALAPVASSGRVASVATIGGVAAVFAQPWQRMALSPSIIAGIAAFGLAGSAGAPSVRGDYV